MLREAALFSLLMLYYATRFSAHIARDTRFRFFADAATAFISLFSATLRRCHAIDTMPYVFSDADADASSRLLLIFISCRQLPHMLLPRHADAMMLMLMLTCRCQRYAVSCVTLLLPALRHDYAAYCALS